MPHPTTSDKARPDRSSPKIPTRERILQSGISLFNEQGFVNVTMRDIAERVGISPGNLAYHYRNKIAILETAYRVMTDELGRLVSGVQLIPSFDNIDRQIAPFVEFQRHYRFFWQDTVEICRALPEIAVTLRDQSANQIASIRAMVDYSVGSGNMVPEPFKGAYDHLARTSWTLVAFWLPATFLNHDSQKGPEPAIWNMIMPFLTPKGRENFKPVSARHGLVPSA